jgi:hypothetical protein
LKAKQERKLTENTVGQQHLNVGPDTVFEFNDTQEFSVNEYVGFSFYQGGNIGDRLILLDNHSTHSTFYVPSLVLNIRQAPN